MSLTKVTYSMIQGAAVNVLDYGADPTGVADSTAAIQAAINTGKTVWIPIGTYSITTLDLKQKYPTIIGESMVATILKARVSAVTMVDAYEVTDGQVVPLFISNLTLDGNNLVTNSCVRVRFRHMSNIENCFFVNATLSGSSGLFAVDAYLTSVTNCRFSTCFDGLTWAGSNHRSAVNSCSFTNCSNTGINCDSVGTALDGNDALVFNNCDVEFGTGLGVYLNVTSAAFYGCYIGESLNGPSFFVVNGNILVSSGIVFFGFTSTSYAVTGSGGFVEFNKCQVGGQTFGALSVLMAGGLKNYYKWTNCSISVTIGGNPVLSGDLLDYGPPALVFAQRLGKNYTGTNSNTTITNALAGNNGRRVTCASVTGASPTIGLQSSLINNSQWTDGQPLYLVLVYKASTVGTLEVKLSGSSFGGVPTLSLGAPTNTTSVATFIKLDINSSNAAYTILEFLAVNCAASDFIEIQECFLADNRMLQNSVKSAVTNLYKC
jgi:hypothetical protein